MPCVPRLSVKHDEPNCWAVQCLGLDNGDTMFKVKRVTVSFRKKPMWHVSCWRYDRGGGWVFVCGYGKWSNKALAMVAAGTELHKAYVEQQLNIQGGKVE